MAWSLVYDGTFNGNAAAPAAGANLPAGPTNGDVAAVGTAGAWTDAAGGIWSIASGVLLATDNSISGWKTHHLLRPSSEDAGDQMIVVELPTSGNPTTALHWFLLRNDRNSTGYLFEFDPSAIGSGVKFWQLVAGTATQLGSTVTLSGSIDGNQASGVTLAVSVTGTTSVTLSFEVRAGATISTTGMPTGGTLLGSGTQVDSSPPAALQGTGSYGLTAGTSDGNTVAAHYDRVQTFNAASGPSMAVSPTTATTSTPETITATGTGTSWASGTTTFSVAGGTGASISGLTVASATSATFTLDPGTAAGTLTIADSSDAATATITVSAPSALSLGALTLAANPGDGTVTIGWPAATGGTGTGYSYSLYRHTTAPFAPPGTGTLVGTTSSTSLVDSSPGGTVAYYRVVVTDSGSNTATSAQSADQGAFVVGVAAATLAIGYVGDSITQGTGATSASPTNSTFTWTSAITYTDAVTQCAAALAAGEGVQAITVTNRGIGGTTSADWSSTSAGSDLANAVAAFSAASVGVVHVMLGTNDAKPTVATTPAAYTANMQAIVAYLRAQLPAATIVLCPAPYLVPGSMSGLWDEASGPLLRQYAAALATLDDGSHVRYVDVGTFEHFADDTSQLNDGVHPNDTGHAALGKLWARQVRRAQVPAGGGGVTAYAT